MNKSKKVKKTLPVIILIAIVVVMSTTTFLILMQNSKEPEPATRICQTSQRNKVELCIDEIVGLTRDEAMTLAREKGFLPKVLSVDGEAGNNADDNGEIVWLTIVDDIITEAKFSDMNNWR